MEICPPEPHLPVGAGLKHTYSAIHGNRPLALKPGCPPAAGLVSDHNAVVVGQGDTAGRGAGLAAQDRLGVQERAVGAPRRALGTAGGRLDAPYRSLDARERQLGTEAAVLAPPGGRPLDARCRHLAPDGGDGRVAGASRPPRHWCSESDLAGSEDAAPADSDSESGPQRQQAWRSETHLATGSAAAAAAGRGTLSQRHRSQPCLLAGRPDYSGVSSRVAAYIQRRRQQDRAARARRRLSPEPPAGVAEPYSAAADAEPRDGSAPEADCRALAARLAVERAEKRERERQLEQLQTEYAHLVTKYAEAETYIDRMRFHRPPGAERPGSGALRRSILSVADGCDARDGDGKMISPIETHTSRQSSPFSRLSGVKSAILRRHSDEESSFRRFVQSKKELFPDDVGSKDSSVSDRGSVDFNGSVKSHVEEGHPCHLYGSPVSVADCVDHSGGPALPAAVGWGPSSAPPALSHCHRHEASGSAYRRGSEIAAGGTSRRDCEPPAAGREAANGRGRAVEESFLSGRESLASQDKGRSCTHSQAVNSSELIGKRGSDGGNRSDGAPVERRQSRDSSPEDRRACDFSTKHLEKSRDVPPGRRGESRDSESLSLSESRDLSLEGGQTSIPSQVSTEMSASSVSSRDSSPERQPSSRDQSPEWRCSSRVSDSTSSEEKSDQGGRPGPQKPQCLNNSVGRNSVAEHQSIAHDRRSQLHTKSRDEVSECPPKIASSFPAKSHSSSVSATSGPSKLLGRSPGSRLWSHSSEVDESAKLGVPLAVCPDEEPGSVPGRRRRSSSDPGFRRHGASPAAAETTEVEQPAGCQPPASRDRLQGVLSVLASQVEVIQAMVGRRGRSSRAARRCRSLSQRISRGRVSVSPGSVVDRVEVVGVPVARRSVTSGGGEAGRCRSESAGRRLGSVDWTAGRRGAAGRSGAADTNGVRPDRDTAGVRCDRSGSPLRRRGGRQCPPPSGPGRVRCRHPAGVGPGSGQPPPPPGRPSAPSDGRRVPEGDDPAARQDGRPAAGTDGGRQQAPSTGSSRGGGRRSAPPAGSSDGDWARQSCPAPEGGHRSGAAVPPLPLSELGSEPADGAGSYCSLVSPRTVSPTRKVEQWRAQLAAVSPEPPPAEDSPAPASRAGPELRRLAGAVRGLQRQMSGFCRLVDELRSPGSPVTPGSPGSSEASGVRRRQRYLRERRGLQLPLLPDKPAPPAAPEPAPGPGGQSSAPGARRWDIRRPPARRAASCERAVQTETAAQSSTPSRPAVSRSDGELRTTSAAAAQQCQGTGASAQWDRANLLAREVNLRSRCILEGVMRSTAC